MASASELEKGKYFMHNGEIVRVVRKEIVTVGTHSHSKLKLFIQGLFTKGQKSIILAHEDKVELLDIIRKTGQVISKTNDKVQIMDSVSYETIDATAPEELLNDINENDEVIFIDFNGNFQIIEKK